MRKSIVPDERGRSLKKAFTPRAGWYHSAHKIMTAGQSQSGGNDVPLSGSQHRVIMTRSRVVGDTVELETIIGLEVHAQVLTKSKMFCSCSAEYSSAPPNTHTCPVCLGLPGALPVMNEAALAMCVKTGIALNCGVASFSKMDRKNYGYPTSRRATRFRSTTCRSARAGG